MWERVFFRYFSGVIKEPHEDLNHKTQFISTV